MREFNSIPSGNGASGQFSEKLITQKYSETERASDRARIWLLAFAACVLLAAKTNTAVEKGVKCLTKIRIPKWKNNIECGVYCEEPKENGKNSLKMQHCIGARAETIWLVLRYASIVCGKRSYQSASMHSFRAYHESIWPDAAHRLFHPI